jgi:hypothetical protein
VKNHEDEVADTISQRFFFKRLDPAPLHAFAEAASCSTFAARF